MREIFTTSLRHKIWFDLWSARQRTLQAVLTIAIGAFAVGMVLSSLRGLEADTRATWATAAAPAIAIRISPPADDALIDALRDRPDLATVEGHLETSIKWRPSRESPWRAASLVARQDYQRQGVSVLQLDAGAWPSGHTLAVERRFPIRIGDSVELRVDGYETSAPVGGLVYNRAIPASSLGGDPVFYTTRERFSALTGQRRYTIIRATLPSYTPERAEAAAARLQADLAERGFTATPASISRTMTTDPDKAWFEELIGGAGLVMQVVAVVTMALSLLLIYTTVTTIITQQTSQIGELKAIGASGGQIMAVYMVLVLAYGIAAAVISLPAAVLASNGMRHVLVAQFGMSPGPFFADAGTLLLQLALCVLAPLITAIFPIMRGARITVREAISSYGLSSTGSALDALLGRITGLSRVLSLALSNVFRNWRRMLLTQLALGGAGVTLVAVLSTQATLGYTSWTLFPDIYAYGLQLDFGRPASFSQIEQVRGMPGVAGVEVWRTVSALADPGPGRGQPRSLQINGLPLPSASYRPQLRAGRWLRPGDTYALTLAESVADELGVGVGDALTLRIPDAASPDIWASQRQWQVVGILIDPNIRNISRTGMAPRDTLGAEAGGGLVGTRAQIDIPAATGASALSIADTLREFYDGRGLDVQITRNDTVYQRSSIQADSLAVLSSLLMVMAVIVALVGGIALSGVLQISVLERRREIGVLRAIGATPGTIRTLFVTEGLVLGWISWLIALALSYPAGLALSKPLAATVGISIVFQYSWAGVALWLALASLIGVVASLAPAQGAIRASVQESLSYE
ncbi:FtsX-like permease family protein [Oscillochloris sp. ZM17-4]|uniref:ABC transporter permease n=1 Tax=Oscillochloris sp. ZM17-4 TaxID=2866714 RepID=UPI001C733809|nr:FtsX-like permease family protein [Oscillochloris sp. ZM17-4]MBX0331017.1 FtsX-like permease family protein [Oscillochloris sp. ZM17-4]